MLSKAESGNAPQISQIEATDYATFQRTIGNFLQYMKSNPQSVASAPVLDAIRNSANVLNKTVNRYSQDLQSKLYNSQVWVQDLHSKFPEKVSVYKQDLDASGVTFDEKGKAVPKYHTEGVRDRNAKDYDKVKANWGSVQNMRAQQIKDLDEIENRKMGIAPTNTFGKIISGKNSEDDLNLLTNEELEKFNQD